MKKERKSVRSRVVSAALYDHDESKHFVNARPMKRDAKRKLKRAVRRSATVETKETE